MNPISERLNPDHVVKTVEILQRRISERFPGSKLGDVCGELVVIARQARERAEWIRRPNILLRIISGMIAALLVVMAAEAVKNTKLPAAQLDALQLVQLIESAINDLLFLFALAFFFFTIETRLKRRKALRAVHELRTMAHLIDMHQLTKDPERLLKRGPGTASSPQMRRISSFELSRYLDYCSEMLSLTGKLAALYMKDYDDPVVLAGVNEVELLTAAIANKIWQKLMIIYSLPEVRGGDEGSKKISAAG